MISIVHIFWPLSNPYRTSVGEIPGYWGVAGIRKGLWGNDEALYDGGVDRFRESGSFSG